MTEENNGGKTGYYDLPLPDEEKLAIILIDLVVKNRISVTDTTEIKQTIDKIKALCPQTLNDIIEYKNLKPWQHEIMKATYALNERALKNPKKGSSKLREVNKILYYAARGKKLILEEEKVVEKPHYKIPLKKVEND